MNETELEETTEDNVSATEENDRRKEARRTHQERRDMIRFELDKEARRSGLELRKDDGGGNWQGVGIES